MWEKEAEEHCNEVLCSVCENPTCTDSLKCREWRDRRAGFYCGAEFGYRKGTEEAKEIIRDLLFHLGNTFIVSYKSREESIARAEQFLEAD